MLDESGIPLLGGVENMAAMDCPHCGEPIRLFPEAPAPRTIWSEAVAKLASIPFSSELAAKAEAGLPLFDDGEEGTVVDAFRLLAVSVTASYPAA